MPNQDVGSLNVSAKTVEEAVELGLSQLGLSRDEVDVEVLKEGKRGVFGLGAENAFVRLSPRAKSTQQAAAPPAEPAPEPEEPAAAEPPPVEPAAAEPAPVVEEEDQEPEPAEEEPEEEDPEEIAKTYLRGLLERMGVSGQVTSRLGTDLVEEGDEVPLVLDITGKDLGILIGRRSQTLRTLQYMLRLMVSKRLERWQPLVIDVESYRVRRRQSLRHLAQKMADQAVARDKKVMLEAMPAYERRIIHIALKNHPKVYTKSVGYNENRKVSIIPK